MKTPESLLHTLLSHIHQDDPRHTARVGLEASVKDAIRVIDKYRSTTAEVHQILRSILDDIDPPSRSTIPKSGR